MDIIQIENDGARIAATNYWELPHARSGLCYLSGNAGVWRLLVPEPQEAAIAEMRTGTRALIERSTMLPGAWDIVFEDGSSEPFFVTLDKRQVDRTLVAGSCRLAVWTQAGLRFELFCEVRP